MRFLVDLSEDDIAELDGLARRNGSSRTAEVREAVRLYLRGRSGNDWIARGAGYWKGRHDLFESGTAHSAARSDRGVD
jgi:metal-responsive CopG/Arc/MetJ family transcriptional regulator